MQNCRAWLSACWEADLTPISDPNPSALISLSPACRLHHAMGLKGSL